MAHYWYSCGVPQQRQTNRQTDGTMGWFEWGANRNFSATHPLGLNDDSDVQVASSNKFSTTPSYIQPTPLAHNTSFLLNSWVPSPVTLSLPMIRRWYMAARPLSEQSADSGRRWKDSTTTPIPTLHYIPSPSSPIDMWRRKSWLIFVQRQCSALLCVAPIDMSSCPRPAVNSLVAQWDAPPPCPQIQFTNTNTIYKYNYKYNTESRPLSSSGQIYFESPGVHLC